MSLFRFWTGTGSIAVLFLDDLQWADPASLELCLCLIEAAVPRLLIVVAYRANELPPAHPSRSLVDEIETCAGERGRVHLGPLSEGEITNLVEDLAPGLPRPQLEALARHVEVRTGGNPHFICQQVLRLRERRELSFDFLRTRWVSAVSTVDSNEGAPDIIRFLADVMRELPVEEQGVLSGASFFSHGASLQFLSTLTGLSPERTAAVVQRLCRRHFMTTGTPEGSGAGVELYRFTHDNIRQAARLLVPSAEQAAYDLRIGRLQRESIGTSHSDEDLYEVVEHLNSAAGHMTDPSEKYETARLDLEAGVKAKRSGAFASSAIYLQAGVALLPNDRWAREYALTLSLHEEAAEASFLVGEFSRMNVLIDAVIKEARCFLDSVRAIEVRIQWLVATNRLQDASRLSMSLIASLEGRTEQKGISVVRHDLAGATRLDGPIVRHVRETRESTVDAGVPEAVLTSRSSFLCAPLLHRGKVKGLIYLENTLAANVFTKERLKVVELLAAQAAVSLENAAVYHLYETVAEQREKLQAAEKLASLGALTAGVAHEVSNPAHVIRLNAASISDSLRNLDTAIEDGTVAGDAARVQARIDGAVREVTSAVDRIESIVGDLKEYMGGGQGESCYEADLNAVVQSVLRLSRPLIRRCTSCAETSLAPDLPSVRGEFGRLQQVVLNLVENACQAITDPAQAVKIQTCTLPGSSWVELTVADEGRGINPGFLSRVTEPLFTTRRAEGGTGLGLAIVSSIVKEYGEELSMESTEGKGTRVRVRLVRAHQPG